MMVKRRFGKFSGIYIVAVFLSLGLFLSGCQEERQNLTQDLQAMVIVQYHLQSGQSDVDFKEKLQDAMQEKGGSIQRELSLTKQVAIQATPELLVEILRWPEIISLAPDRVLHTN